MTKPTLTVFLAASLAAGHSATAQIRAALIGGLHTANLVENNQLPGWQSSTGAYYSGNSGFQLGLLGDIPLGNGFFLQPGLDYSAKGRTFQKFYDTAAAATDTLFYQAQTKLSYVEIPAYVTRRFALSRDGKTSFYLGAGPYVALIYGATANTQQRIYSYDNDKETYSADKQDLLVGNAPGKYRTADIGFGIRAGLEIGRVMLGGYFTQGLTNAYQAAYPGTFRNRTLGVSLGIWLAKTETKRTEPVLTVTNIRKKVPVPGPQQTIASPLVVAEAPSFTPPAYSFPAQAPRVYRAESIAFESSSARLTSGSAPAIRALADSLAAGPQLNLLVEGYTDNSGSEAKNLALSQARADAVKSALVAAGVDAGRILTKGSGSQNPVADNAFPQGRARNRRVVLTLREQDR